MRFWIPFLALTFCGAAVAVEALPHSADAMVCRYGLCRFDEMYDTAAATSMEPGEVAALLQQDPNNPNAWCTYAEFLALNGKSDEAAGAFEHAVALAPDVPSVAMRAANFFFTHDHHEEAFQLSANILRATGAYDEVLFSYLRMARVSTNQLEGTAVPSDRRAAKAWLTWLIDQNATQDDILSAYRWAQANHISGDDLAPLAVNEFWKRHQYQTARMIWTESQLTQPGAPASGQILGNPHFQQKPNPVPFDWNLTPSSDVEIDRDASGLDVHFLGRENIDFRGVRQYAAVRPGRYRFIAEISSEGLTTDRLPFFQIADGESAARLSANSTPVPANIVHFKVALEVLVAPQTRILNIQVVRPPSWKFDNKIEGHLRIHSVSLTPLF